jgi:type I restriction enzyme S subunit
MKNNDWIDVKFGDIALSVTDRIDKPTESGLDIYIGLDHLDTDQIRIKRFGSTNDVEATKFLCKKGDIIFGKRNSYLRKVAVTDRDAVVSAHSMILRPKGNLIDPEFLPCFMQSNLFWVSAQAISEGSMSPTIKWKTLANRQFKIPPINEQKKIAKILWTIEDNIQKTEKLIEITEKLKRGLLEQLLTKGIGHKKFKKTEVGEIPEEWPLVHLSDCIDIDPENLSMNTAPDYKMEYVDISSIEKTGIISKTEFYKFSESPLRARKCVKFNDVIVSMVRPTLKAFAIIKSENDNVICSTGFAVLRQTDRILSGYIYYFVLSNLFMNQIYRVIVGSNYPAINKRELSNFLIPLPIIKEQKEIIQKLTELDNLMFHLDENYINLNRLKQKLTNDLISGHIRIPKEALNDL